MTHYFSRLTLKRDPANDALKALIDPPDKARRTDAHHRLLWTVFSDGADRQRDFLWRAEGRGRFYTLSSRPPQAHGLFEEPEVKEFAPVLSAGDRLSFLLRANAVRSLPGEPVEPGSGKRKRGTKVDVAMHLLHAVPGQAALPKNANSKRAPERYRLARQASRDWLERQGETGGFSVDTDRFVLDDYSTVTLPGYCGKRMNGEKREPRFGIFNMKGEITVTDPGAFVAHLFGGFGRAKAYGCGLMMIRRA